MRRVALDTSFVVAERVLRETFAEFATSNRRDFARLDHEGMTREAP